MRFETWDNYIDTMLSQVKFRFDHKDIRLEYEEHMEDKLEFLMNCGMDEESAAREVLTEMGEPESLGKALNEIHNPLLGWIWWVSRLLVKCVVILCVLTTVMYIYSCVSSVIFYNQPSQKFGEEISTYEIDEKFNLGHADIMIDEAVFYEGGDMVLKYRVRKHIFEKSRFWSFGIGINDVKDEDGKQYWPGNTGRMNWLGQWYKADIENISADAEKIIIDSNASGYRIYVEIPVPEALKEGDKH